MITIINPDKLQMVPSASRTTTESACYVSYTEFTSTTATTASQRSITSTNTTVDILGTPSGSNTRTVLELTIYNADTVAATFTIQNNSAGTLTPLAYVTLQAGDSLHYEDGVGWYVCNALGQRLTGSPTLGSLIRAPQVITSGTTYVAPAGATAVEGWLIGGGGGGGGVSSSAANAAFGGGGAAGSVCYFYCSVVGGTTYTIAVAGGGTAGANTGGTGGTGGSTTFNNGTTTYAGNGGTGGVGMVFGTGVLAALGGAGGTSTNGLLNPRSMPGCDGIRLSGTVGVAGNGGTSPYGGGGQGSNADNTAGATGGVYGGGGAGASTLGGGAQTGGVGGAGVILLREYY